MRPDNLRFLLPSGRSLSDSTLRHLKAGGITVARSHERCYSADMWHERGHYDFSVESLPRQVFFAKPDQVVRMVYSGEYDAGITGFDMLHEIIGPKGSENHDWWTFEKIEICGSYQYGRNGGKQEIALFTKHGSGAADFQRRPTNSDRVASEYPNITRRLFEWWGRNPIVEPSVGCVETRVLSGDYLYGVTLVESGETLRANNFYYHSKLMDTYPVLIANKSALEEKCWLKDVLDNLDRTLKKSLNSKESN